ncbi:S9 family peptidase [Nakamurella antarctica]|uniref:S9 family peptidase n=1 Tax=Nakamurella antarctica TaxID=1902245 RepID=A0A3G8ZMM1_9ACTN|nr:prolyl oligopeptidase family serine peptidase [Nakamurella antarctica]AZI58569.1 S9 family peptidase [Nakamurella antarctica]
MTTTDISSQSPAVVPYGAWPSPISAADLAANSHPVSGGAFVAQEIWFTELRPMEGGRQAIRRVDAHGFVSDVLPAPWNARSRVHEYGGTSWTPYGDHMIFAEFTDQRLYRLDPSSGEPPVALTPADTGFRFCDFHVRGGELIAVRETHSDAGLSRDICAVPLDGSAARDPAGIRSIVSGSHFLAYPRYSPDGSKLAWISWEHPQMPWDGTELRVGDIDPDGAVSTWRSVIGSTTESVLQPHWTTNDELMVLSDRTGFWNLYSVADAPGGSVQPLCAKDVDFAAPLWQLGRTFFLPLDDRRVLTVRTHGTDRMGILDLNSGDLVDVAPELTSVNLGGIGRTDGTGAGELLLVGGSGGLASGLRKLDLATGALTDVRLAVDALPDPELLPLPEAPTFISKETGRDVHTFLYPPRNPMHVGPHDELPPYVAFVHGGPTGHVSGSLSVLYAYFTSRGIGVIDVNYGGSSGYGREYRNRLRGQWGVVDVQDVVTAVVGLADAGLADRNRLAIEGGSAGGWTVLAALTSSNVFACGASYYGVAELAEFVKETHDFESRYVDGLVGPWPEAAALYAERAPLNHVDNLACPVLLLQGLDDPIVPPAGAERFRDAMVGKGIPHAYLAFEGESHGFRRAETIIAAREAELSFYGQTMGFTPPGVPVLPLHSGPSADSAL